MTYRKLMLIPALAFVLTGCDIDVEDPGRLPSVDVDVQGGELPDLDVDMADVDVETETIPVEVPTDIDIDFPEDPGEVGDGAPPSEHDD